MLFQLVFLPSDTPSGVNGRPTSTPGSLPTFPSPSGPFLCPAEVALFCTSENLFRGRLLVKPCALVSFAKSPLPTIFFTLCSPVIVPFLARSRVYFFDPDRGTRATGQSRSRLLFFSNFPFAVSFCSCLIFQVCNMRPRHAPVRPLRDDFPLRSYPFLRHGGF